MFNFIIKTAAALAFFAAIALLYAPAAYSHCDTMDGPVIADALSALESGDVTPVLKWVGSDYETEIRAVFGHVLKVRKLGPEAAELADNYFFETLVRIHREGEGAPYTGIKPAGTKIEPGVAEADAAILSGKPEAIFPGLHALLVEGITHRLERVLETKKHANDSVDAGREYVEAYVEFVHYVEALFAVGGAGSGHAHEASTGAAPRPASAHAH